MMQPHGKVVRWSSEFASFFGIALMDGGAVLRYRLSKKLSNHT